MLSSLPPDARTVTTLLPPRSSFAAPHTGIAPVEWGLVALISPSASVRTAFSVGMASSEAFAAFLMEVCIDLPFVSAEPLPQVGMFPLVGALSGAPTPAASLIASRTAFSVGTLPLLPVSPMLSTTDSPSFKVFAVESHCGILFSVVVAGPFTSPLPEIAEFIAACTAAAVGTCEPVEFPSTVCVTASPSFNVFCVESHCGILSSVVDDGPFTSPLEPTSCATVALRTLPPWTMRTTSDEVTDCAAVCAVRNAASLPRT